MEGQPRDRRGRAPLVGEGPLRRDLPGPRRGRHCRHRTARHPCGDVADAPRRGDERREERGGRVKGFARAGHLPTLVAALLYFDVSFMVWVLLGPLAPFLREDLGLTASQQGLLTAIPLLGGSLFRPLLGMLADRIGARRTGMFGLVLTLVPLMVGWQYAHTAMHFYTLGFFLGIAGASFAVALPLASRWYPPEYQGLAMGIAGAGNSGTLLATLFAPRLAERYGWSATFAFAAVPVVVVLVVFACLAK